LRTRRGGAGSGPSLALGLGRGRRTHALGAALGRQRRPRSEGHLLLRAVYLPELDEQTWLRFVEGRPVSGVTTRFLSWCLEELAEAGKKVLVLVWDNASWHISKEVRRWMGEHNRQVKKGEKEGVRIISCLLPKKSPWLNPIEPKWMHGKRRVVEAERLLSAQEVAERVCSAFDCPHHEHLSLPEKVA
jgi:transposase